MDKGSNAFLETEPLGRLMVKYAVPCVISLLVAALYNIVDQIFIANADYLGSYGNAANTVVFPLTVVALAIAVMIGDGCCAFVSISLGAGRKDDAHRSIGSAVLGIVMKFFQIVISIAVGLAAGCIPVVGYNIGAGRCDRARTLFFRLLAAEAAVGGAALLIVELFSRQLIGIFGAANESACYTDYAVKCFRVYLSLTVLATVNKGTFIYLQSLGKAFASTAISLVREVVFGVGFALLLPRRFGLNGVLYSMPASDALTFLVCVAAIVYTCRTLDTRSRADTPQTARFRPEG